MSEETKLLEIKEVLPILKCTENTFRTWIKRKQLPAGLIMRIGNTQRVRANILNKWLNGEIE
ncbi:MAG: helix-turn-helix domain-containing protein [Cyanobacteriota bacterium]|nr:helix-turn-helix domain-containing protein [Cyanobacteriota bacterium]MDY6364342.1 helix-turn-helix domain-containing protein [Cyanobacteriota bacterium]